jgi:hypothetical protein
MCDLCEGMPVEEQMRLTGLRILEHGYTKVAVEGRTPWVYTVGLSHRLHPELLVAGSEIPAAAEILDRLAQRVLDGERLTAGTKVTEDGLVFGIGQVHHSRLRAGLCAAWDAHGRVPGGMRQLVVLQVKLPDELFCTCHAGSQLRLDLPGGVPGAPNRAMRRSKRRPPR